MGTDLRLYIEYQEDPDVSQWELFATINYMPRYYTAFEYLAKHANGLPVDPGMDLKAVIRDDLDINFPSHYTAITLLAVMAGSPYIYDEFRAILDMMLSLEMNDHKTRITFWLDQPMDITRTDRASLKLRAE